MKGVRYKSCCTFPVGIFFFFCLWENPPPPPAPPAAATTATTTVAASSATTTAATPEAASTAATEASAATPAGLWTRLIDAECSRTQLLSVHYFDSLVGFFFVPHLSKTKPSSLSR